MTLRAHTFLKGAFPDDRNTSFRRYSCGNHSPLGPVSSLAGTWEGDRGVDIAPAKEGSHETHFRERLQFDPIGPVVNGSQVLYGLRYSTVAWPLIQEQPFHEEAGYWLWDAVRQQVMQCFMVPRGVLEATDDDRRSGRGPCPTMLGNKTHATERPQISRPRHSRYPLDAINSNMVGLNTG
ncbi:MAG TPA: heme-binding beta-barrel domain-containing protein [Nitrospirales bacterium]|nr:heme-binding beta-barrel domain-containing protein [Nitrospirales bacterium]